MGIAATQGRLAVGTSNAIIEFKNNPALAQSLSSTPPLDACYVPRNTRFTGDVDIHEMAWGIKSELASSLSPAKPTEPELWFINSRFSCICTKDNEHSFSPRWRPRFIDSYSPQDRCHLNGMALVDGTPRYVTALGQSNKASGWRENKANGGILMDVPSGDVICQGLSMPHSPRGTTKNYGSQNPAPDRSVLSIFEADATSPSHNLTDSLAASISLGRTHLSVFLKSVSLRFSAISRLLTRLRIVFAASRWLTLGADMKSAS